MSAQGETTWSSKGKNAPKYEFPVVPSQDWEAKIVGDKFEIQKASEPGSLPYIKGRLELIGSAVKEGGKNLYLFPMFWLSLKPGKDGVASPERASNILGLAKALGEETPDFPVITVQNKEGQSEDMLDPRAVLGWFRDHDGMTVKLHSKIETYKDKKQAVVDYYIESAAQANFA